MRILDGLIDDFTTELCRAGTPAVVRGGVRAWRAVGGWTPDTLRRRYGHRQVTVRSDAGEMEFSLGEYLSLLCDDPDEVEPLPYLRNVFVSEVSPRLMADVSPLPFAAHDWLRREPLASLVRAVQPEWIDWCELFISPARTRFPYVHVDRYATHAWCAQVFGAKRYWLWPRCPSLRPIPCADLDLDALRELGDATVIDLAPGDVVYIPSGHPHTAESLSVSITTSGNFVDASNGEDFLRALWQGDVRPRLAGEAP